jgi:hypothetical protein
MKKQNLLTLVILFFTTILFAQEQPEKRVDWTRMSDNPNATFYEVVEDFNNYWKDKTPEKGKGYKVFKRWEAEMAPKVFPTGNMSLTQTAYQNYLDWQKTQSLNKNGITKSTLSSNWTALGPIGSPTGPPGQTYTRTGAGRLTFLRFDPTNAATMYVGAADGGLWKSTNSGASWSTNSDFLSVIGCSDLCIDPTNTQIMYLATGDIAGSKNSIGVLKSTDGGTTWNTTSLIFPITNYYRISKMIMDPTNPLIMIVATNGGIFKTTNGWTSNTQPLGSGNFNDMEFKPGDSNTVYVAGTTFFKSTDKGSNWTQITSGLPSSGVARIALGVSAGNSAYVYALIGRSSDQGFLGMYRSTDSGTTFSTRATTPNLLGYETNGLDVGGQAFYDLAVVVSATDAENVITGGVNHWQSTNGGTTWTNLSYWASGQVHADVHDVVYSPDGLTLYSANDGGLHKTTNGTSWTDISNNLNISQLIGLGNSIDDETRITIGTQDNGTSYKSGSTWKNIRGGDGGETFIDPIDSNVVYTQYVYGAFARQTASPETSTTITTGLPTPLSTNFDFYSPWKMDPVNNSRLYAGGAIALYTSANKGTNWTALGTPSGSGRIKGLAIAPSNTTYIYCIKSNAISVSTDSGAIFTNKTGTLPVGSASLSDLCISNTDPLKVWVTFSGYSSGNKVFKTVDGGTNWTNVSTGLPNIAMNTIVYTNNTTNDAVYVGSEIGVYYRNNNASFTIYNTNLPNTNIKDLEIYYPTLKLRAATYGRGVWESPLNVTSVDITASAGANGRISPTGTVSVITGTNQTFTIIPASCYSIATVLVNGVNNPAAVSSGTYTFTNVTTTQTISATFIADTPFVISTLCIPPASPSNLGNFNVGPTKVVLGTINSETTGSLVSNSNQVFYDYTPIHCQTGFSTNLTVASNPQTITVSCTLNNQRFSAWIDYNNNGTFETGELIVTNQAVTNGVDTPFTFSIPSTGVILNTGLRMRVIGDISVNSSTAPCGQRNYGQVEDYQVTVLGDSTTWTGAVDTSWANAANWTNGVPTATVEATINAVTNLPVISVAATTKKLTVNATASVTVTPNNSLTVVNNIVNNGTITFENNASLVQINNVSNTGNISYKRNTSALKPYDFIYWSTPVNAQNLKDIGFNNGIQYNYWFNSDVDVYNWVGVETSSVFPMANGIGYATRYTYTNTPAGVTKTFLGVPNNGDYTVTIKSNSTTQGGAAKASNLIGNPYPSAIDIVSFYNDNSAKMHKTYNIWTHNGAYNSTNNNYSTNDYMVAQINATNNGYTTLQTVNSQSFNGFIPAGQSFFIDSKIISQNETVAFKNSQRVTGNNSQFFRNAQNINTQENNSIVVNSFKLNVANNLGFFKQTYIAYSNVTTNDYDNEYDYAYPDTGNSNRLYSVLNNSLLGFQYRAPFINTDEVLLGFNNTVAGEFKIEIDSPSSFFDNQDIFVKDNLLNTYHNLKVSPYVFTEPNGVNTSRFKIVYQSPLSNNTLELETIKIYKNAQVIYANAKENIKSVKIFDLTGRVLVEKNNINEAKFSYNTEHFALGVLIIQVITENGKVSTKKVL